MSLKRRWKNLGVVRQAPVLAEIAFSARAPGPRLPFRVRVGVTGHRTLLDEAAVEAAVREVLDTIETSVLPRREETPVRYTVVSALAEGADRLVARVVLEREGAKLEAVLPLPREDFVHDFETTESREAFAHLARKAVHVYEPPPDEVEQRPEAYLSGGLRLVDHVDVLIAVWDGLESRGTGGTADVVAYARELKVPVFVVGSQAPYRLERPPLPGQTEAGRLYRFRDAIDLRFGQRHERSELEHLRDQFEHLDTFNRERVPARRLDASVAAERGYLGAAPEEAGYQAFAEWSLPYFARADILAGLYQWAYTRLAFLVFALAGAAVTFAAAQAIYLPEHDGLIFIEVLFMVFVIVLVIGARVWHHHLRWITYRSLAENLRSAPFIAAIAETGASGREGEDRLDANPRAAWFQRAFTEIWADRRPTSGGPRDGEAHTLATFFDDAWIAGQIDYHGRRSVALDRYHHRLSLLINVLFLATFVAALLHTLGLGPPKGTLVFLAISLPAIAASLSGYRELRQFGLHAERFRRAGDRLARIRTRMLAELNPVSVRKEAAAAYAVMRDENLDWFGVVEFQEIQVVA
jgi:conflict system pore-forming effector with SLATT domain